jgi:hypothetical protein
MVLDVSYVMDVIYMVLVSVMDHIDIYIHLSCLQGLKTKNKKNKKNWSLCRGSPSAKALCREPFQAGSRQSWTVENEMAALPRAGPEGSRQRNLKKRKTKTFVEGQAPGLLAKKLF